jgi:hypothetical protein
VRQVGALHRHRADVLGRGSRVAGRALAGAVLVAVALCGCAGGASRTWGEAVPRDERDLALAGLSADAQRAFMPLSQVFYERIASRRVNSRATFDDPSVRQFFPSVAAYSDYYAALVDALDSANVRNNQPTRIELLGLTATADGVLKLSCARGGTTPASLVNATCWADEWQWQAGRTCRCDLRRRPLDPDGA